MIRESMTFGEMPTREAFEEAFDEVCPHGHYNIGNNPHEGDYTSDELWNLITERAEDWDDEKNGPSLASCIMETLGFEWV